MTHRRTRRTGAALAAVMLLAACGSDDESAANDEPTADADADATEPEGSSADEPTADEPTADEPTADEPSADEPSADGGDDGDLIVIDDFDDIPDECVDVMADFLREVEDVVSSIDWDTATLGDVDALGATLDTPTDGFDARMGETGCDRYDIGVDDEQGLEFALSIAEREAPGTVGWLEFIASFATLSETGGGENGSAGLPSDCEGTKSFLLDQADEYPTIEDVPASEFTTLMSAVQNLAAQCSLEDAGAFFDNPEIADFLGR